MAISLPTDPNGEQYEDLIISSLLVLGYFVEANMILSQDGKEILELDVVATPVGHGATSRFLVEIKKEGFSFSNTFKLYGQKEYLKIPHACLVSMRGAAPEHLPVYQGKGTELGIRMCHLPLTGAASLGSLADKQNTLDDNVVRSLIAPLWYLHICRRVALSELKRNCKDLRGNTQYDNAREYLFATRASFFEREALARAETLYQAYFDHPKLSGALVASKAAVTGGNEDAIWERARDSHEHLDIQCMMDLESQARFKIVKNALDDAFERGDAPPPATALKIGAHSFNVPRHNLPPKYFTGLQEMRKHPHGAKIPFLFEVFYTAFGGYVFFEDDDELALLSAWTTIPPESIVECLRFMDNFFGNFFFENNTYKMLLMKGVPGIVRGGGAFARQHAFKIKDYREKYGKASWLLDKWHNATYFALEPHLKQFATT